MLIAALICISLTALACQTPILPDYAANRDVLYFRDFALNAEPVDLKTSVKGTIFVRGDRGKTEVSLIQISARVEIDPRDWGGVTFYAPVGWQFSRITSDYPQGNPNPEKYVAVFTSGDMERAPWTSIGSSKYSSNSGGGEGSLIIDMEPSVDFKDLPENQAVIVAIGSKGDVVMNPVSQTIPLPLNIDYHTPAWPVAVNVEADSLTIAENGCTFVLTPSDPGFTDISRMAVKLIQSVDSAIPTPVDREEIQKLKDTSDYLEIAFNPPVEITTSRLVGSKWKTVTISSAVFFLSGKYYRLAAWPEAGQDDRYYIYGSRESFVELESLIHTP